MPIYLYSFLFCLAVTVLFHHVLFKKIDEKKSSFANKYMLLTTVKLLIYLFFVAAYLYFVKINVIWFVIMFLFLYASFSIFEVLTVLSILKKKQDRQRK